MDACFYEVKLGVYEVNIACWLSENEFVTLFYFLCVQVTIAIEQNIITACREGWIKTIFHELNLYIFYLKSKI